MEKILFGDGWHSLEYDKTPFIWSTEKSSLFINDKDATFIVLTFAIHPDTSNLITISQGTRTKDFIISESRSYIIFELDRIAKIYPQEIVISTQTFIPSKLDINSTDLRSLGQCLISIRVNVDMIPLEKISLGNFLIDRKQSQSMFGLHSRNIDVWCLTLKSTPKREEYVRNHLDSHNLQYRMFYGLDALETGISSPLINNQKYTKIDDWLTVGQVGCYISHYMLWQNILESSADSILILEDDVHLEDEFVFKLNEYLYHVPEDWGLLYIGYESLQGVNPLVISDKISEGFPACTYAYMIKKSTIPILLNEVKPITCPVDTTLRYKLKDKVKSYVLTPQLAHQKSSLLNRNNVDPIFKSMTYDWDRDVYKIKNL